MELDKQKEIIYWLCRLPSLASVSIGPVTIGRMLQIGGSFSGLYNIEGMEWAKAGILSEKMAERLEQAKEKFSKTTEEYHSLSAKGIKFITILDEAFPNRLRTLPDCPVALSVKGNLPEDEKPSAAIIGSRNATTYGLEAARCFGRELAGEGVQIVSGLAYGIDGAGHRGALEGGGKTYGVLGCGINICYPREHYPLYEQAVKSGGVLTEYCLGERPQPRNFPVRNRIISGLSDCVLVVEAREKSGSLITAGLALEQGRDVFAVPGRITDPGSAGCNQLIQSGAFLAASPGDIMEYFGIKYGKKLSLHEKNEKGLAKREKMLYACLDLQPKHLENIASESGLPLSECMMILLDLELKGFAVHTGGSYYGRRL